jgi:hypothetical protein
MRSIIDTGFLYAIVDSTDRHHQVAIATLRQIRNDALVLPTATVVELSMLINEKIGRQATSQFMANLGKSSLQLEVLTKDDLVRISELLLQYQDARLDFVDAAITSIAERLNIQRVLTVDQRDFRMIRPKHCAYFEILP